MKWLAREHLTPETSLPEQAGLCKFFTIERDAVLEESRRVRVVASTSDPDREKDTIAVTGWQLANYRRNPVVLFGHDYRSLPVAKTVAIRVEEDRLVMETEFATAEENPFADVCYKLVKGGYLNAVSVGFRPIKWNYNEERRGYDFLEQELLELSYVPIPAHPQALVEARDAGLDLALLKQWHEGLGEHLKELEPEPEGVTVGSLTIVDTAPILDEPETKADTGDLTVDKTAELLATLVKQGRVLSAANESKIRSAVASLTEVLGALETAADDDGKAAPQAETKSDAVTESQRKATPAPTTGLQEEIDMTPAALRDLVQHEVRAALTAVTGRLS